MIKLSALIKRIFISLAIVPLATVWAIADERTCPTLEQYTAEGSGDNFLLSGAYDIITRACTNVVEFTWNSFAEPLQAVIGLAGAIYIAVYTLKNIGTFSQQDPAAYLTNEKSGVIIVAVKTAVVIWLLGNQEFLYKYIVGLAVDTGMEIGSLVTGGSGISGSVKDVGGLFAKAIKQIKFFNDQIYAIVATGRELLCLTFLPDSILDWNFVLFPFGAVLYIYGWLILISFSFYVLDVLFRLGVGCIVLPLAVACGFSKLTSTYMKKTWDLFVNVAFNFIMLGVIISFTTALLQQAVLGNDLVVEKLNSGQHLNDADVDLVVEVLDGAHFILMTFCCVISFKLFMEVEQIAGKVSSTSSVGKLGQEIGAAASAPVVKAGKTLAQEGWHLAGAVRKETGSTIKNSNNFVGKTIRGAEQGLYYVQRTVRTGASKTEGFVFGTGRHANLNMWKRGYNAVRSWF